MRAEQKQRRLGAGHIGHHQVEGLQPRQIARAQRKQRGGSPIRHLGEQFCADGALRFLQFGGVLRNGAQLQRGIGLGQRQRHEPGRDAVAQRAALVGFADAHRRHYAEVQARHIHAPILEEAPHCAGDHGQHHIVERAAQAAAHELQIGQRQRPPIEAAVGADALIQRRRRGRAQRNADGFGRRPQPHQNFAPRIPRFAQQRARVAEGQQPPRGAALQFSAQQFQRRRRGARGKGRRFHNLAGGVGRQNHIQQIHAGYAVYHAVVRLADEGEAVAGQPLHHPQLPERARAVQALRHDPGRKLLDLPLVAGARQAGVANVVIEVEALVVHPHGRAVNGHKGQLLPVARNAVQHAGNGAANARQINAAFCVAQRPRIVNGRGGHMHTGVGALQQQEGVVEGGEGFVVARHQCSAGAGRAAGAPGCSARGFCCASPSGASSPADITSLNACSTLISTGVRSSSGTSR